MPTCRHDRLVWRGVGTPPYGPGRWRAVGADAHIRPNRPEAGPLADGPVYGRRWGNRGKSSPGHWLFRRL